MPTIDRVQTFHREQKVKFVGGEGIVWNFKSEAERWLYVVEMPLGQEPEFGRIGAETMVLLRETEVACSTILDRHNC